MHLAYLFLIRNLLLNSSTQLFARQEVEDGDAATRIYALNCQELDTSDPDGEHNLPIPLARPAGKPSPYLPNPSYVRQEPADPTDECILLDVIDAPPISFAYPFPSAAPESKDTAEEVLVVSRKHPRAGTAESGPSQPAAKKKKLIKKAANRPQKPRVQS